MAFPFGKPYFQLNLYSIVVFISVRLSSFKITLFDLRSLHLFSIAFSQRLSPLQSRDFQSFLHTGFILWFCRAPVMPTNRAAWQDKAGVELAIRHTPYPTTLLPTQILFRPHAWAINPADTMIQDSDELPFISYPLILGEDAAGVVISVGSAAAARFKPNDRVLVATVGSASGKSQMGGFQEYVIAETGLACHIPDFMSFAEASVFPLCVTTPSFGLFGKDWLGLPPPQLEPVSNGKSILVWGGSSAVGSNAIQLAKAAGFEVFSTTSPRNFEYVKNLGAIKVFDYSSETVVSDIVKELDQTDCAGIFQAVGSAEECLQIADKARGDLFVATATAIPEDKVPQGVRAKMVFGTGDFLMKPEIGPAVFETFLPQALAQRKYKVAPEPFVVGTTGLEGLQEGFDILKKGVSVKKIVVLAE